MDVLAQPASGAPAEDLVPAIVVGVLAVAAIVAYGIAHRRGRIRELTRLAALSERVSGLPGWAALPAAIAGGSLLIAVFGFYADVATHIDNGRDPGPFANAFHYPIILGLAGIALAGIVAVLLGRDDDPSAIRIADGWHAPVGGALLLLCGGVAVAGFPLDDVWHRLFGQDVTLWSPTHIQMVGGATLSTLALWVLVVEGRRAAPAEANRRLLQIFEVLVAGAFLLGLSALQAEFDYSVPQFRLLYHPVLIMGSAGAALVAARIRLGKGAALAAVGFFLMVRGVLSLVVGPVMDHTPLHFPLYLVEALAVEVVALRVDTQRQLRFAAVSGVAIGTFGLAAEWAWSHVWMTMSWPASLAPEGVPLGFLAAMGGAMLGGLIGRAFTDPGPRPRQAVPKAVAVATGAALLFVLVYPFPTTEQGPGSAAIAASPVPGREGWARLAVTLDPPTLADDSEWFVVTAWQGNAKSVVEPLEPRGEGLYAASSPIPVAGEWKTLVRLHDDRALLAVPVFLPEDPTIPAEGVAVPDPGAPRPFVSDKEILLREARDVSFGLTAGASGALALLVVAWVAAMAWGLHRIDSQRRPPRAALGSTAAA